MGSYLKYIVTLALIVFTVSMVCIVGDSWVGMRPEDISTWGHKLDYLFNYTTILNLFYFILVCAGIFGFSFLYHHKRHPKAYFTYGNKKMHINVVTVIGVAVFLTIDLNITRMSNDDLLGIFWNWPKKEEEKVLKVQVMAQQWAWNFRYAGADEKFNTDDDIVTVNDLRIPKGYKIYFHLTSKDVIHAFYVPNVRLKVDTIPGRITRIWWDANKTGVYDIACAEMCGTHHYLMKAQLTVYEEAEFFAWRDEAREIALATNDPENLDLYWGWSWDLKK